MGCCYFLLLERKFIMGNYCDNCGEDISCQTCGEDLCIANKSDMKQIWYYWFLGNPVYWPHGLTMKKSIKLMSYVFNDENIWKDLFEVCNMKNKFPWNEKEKRNNDYGNAISIFVSYIESIAFKLKLIK